MITVKKQRIKENLCRSMHEEAEVRGGFMRGGQVLTLAYSCWERKKEF